MADELDEWSDVEAPPQEVSEPASDGDVTGSIPDDDEWNDVAPAEQSQGAPVEAAADDDDWEDVAPKPEWSQGGSLVAGMAKGAVPTAGGLAAGLYAGAATTAATAPLLGPAAPIAGILAGLGVGMGASWLADLGQDKLLAMVGWDKPLNEAKQANPYTFEAGQMLPAAALLRPNLKSLDLIQRGVGAGIGTAVEAGMQTIHGEGYDIKKIGMAAGMGAALPRTNFIGDKVLASGAQVGARYRGGNKNPDVKPVPEEAPTEADITIANDEPIVAGGVATEQPPAPDIPGVGNPEGAPGSVPKAARPSDPTRNYEKGQEQNQPVTTESKVIDTEPMKSDIKAALLPEEGTAPRPDGTDVLPQEAAPPTVPADASALGTPEFTGGRRLPPLHEQHADDVRAAETEGMKRAAEKGKQGQDGELFHDIEQPAKAEPEALTPAEAKALAEDRKILAKAGFDRALAHLDAVSPREQVAKIREFANVARQQMTAAEGVKPAEAEARRPDGELRKESRKKVEATGVLARDKADAARKEGAIKFASDSYTTYREKLADLDPLDVSKAKENRQRLKDTWAEIVAANKGIDPTVRSKNQYVPLKQGEGHAEAYQWLKALKAAATGQNQKNFAAIHRTQGMGEIMRETGKIEGDIARRPQTNEAGAEAEIAQGAMEHSRESFEHMNPDPRPNADNSYVDAHNALADWINDLPPRQYEKLAEKYDLKIEMNEPADPASLMSDMRQTLADTGRRPKGELTSEVELPPKRVKAPTLPQMEEPQASAGRKLDKNSDEFKRLAAQYGGTAKPAKSKAEQLEDLSAKERSAAEAINGSTHEALVDKVKSFVGDESGAGFLHRMFSQPANPSSPAALPGPADYARDLSKKFFKLTGDTKNLKVEIMANLARAADAKLKPHEHRQIALAEQDNKVGALPQHLKDFYDQHVAPVRSRAMQVMRDFKDLNDTERLGYDLPNLNAVTTKAYQPRYQVDKQAMNRGASEAFDPFTGQGMGDYSPNLEDRKFFSLETRSANGGNDRMVVEVTGDKDTGYGLNIHRAKNAVVKLANLPASFEGKLGDVVNLNVKGTKAKWTIDQATTKEIEGATGVKYYENAAWNWSRMLDDMTRAYENAKLTTEIKNDPEFAKLTTTDKKVAEANGWSKTVTTHLPEFATRRGLPLYMPDNMRWAFDDYHKPGFGGITGEGIEKMRNFNIALLKVFNTNAPLVHVLNELDLFVVDRGFKWINPKAYYQMAVAAPKAFKSVNSQDKLQAEMRSAGTNPMLASVGMRAMYETAAKQMGMEIIKDHSKWDPVARTFGVSTKEVGQKLYDLSSDVTWRLSDYLTTIRYLEEKANGRSPEEAATRVNKFMSDYHIGTTVMGSRALQQMLTEPAVTAFGRYKAGIFRSLSHMTRDLLAPSATKQERLDALGQWLVMGVMGYMVYPAADALVRKVTGNEGGELRRRGVTSVADAAVNMVKGDKDPVAVATRAWTPAPALSAGMDLVKNKDFAGKSIIPQGEWPGVLPDAAANVTEYAAKTMVPPYGAISQHYARPEGSVGGALGAFAADQVGVGLPSDASVKRQGKIEKINSQADKARSKRPGGVIPDLMNRLTD